MAAKFAAMQAEWLVLRRKLQASTTRWEQTFAELEREEARLRDDGLWLHGREDFLGVLGWQRDELAHSRVVAWLLDPCARHGLGSRVLAGLLEEVFGSARSVLNLGRARTTCEVPLLDGRLDIVVKAPGLYLVIENKVDAEEGDEQCAYYSRHLSADAICILFSPDGRQSNAESSFRPLRYAQFAGVLRRALAGTTKQGPGRRIAEDYLQTLETEFS